MLVMNTVQYSGSLGLKNRNYSYLLEKLSTYLGVGEGGGQFDPNLSTWFALTLLPA